MSLSDDFPWLEGVEDWAENIGGEVGGFLERPLAEKVAMAGNDWLGVNNAATDYLGRVAAPLAARYMLPTERRGLFDGPEAVGEIGAGLANAAASGLAATTAIPLAMKPAPQNPATIVPPLRGQPQRRSFAEATDLVTNRLNENLTTDRLIPGLPGERSAGSQLFMESVAEAGKPIEQAGTFLGDKVADSGGTPLQATAAELVPHAAAMLFPFGKRTQTPIDPLKDFAANRLPNPAPLVDRVRGAFGDIGAKGPGKYQQGALKIENPDQVGRGLAERYTPRHFSTDGAGNFDTHTRDRSYSNALTIAEETLVSKPPIETREADMQQRPSANEQEGALFGSSFPEAMRFIDKNTGNARSWKKQLERKGVYAEEINRYLPNLAAAADDVAFTRDEIFDDYEAVPEFQMGVRRGGDGLGPSSNDRAIKRAQELADAYTSRKRARDESLDAILADDVYTGTGYPPIRSAIDNLVQDLQPTKYEELNNGLPEEKRGEAFRRFRSSMEYAGVDKGQVEEYLKAHAAVVDLPKLSEKEVGVMNTGNVAGPNANLGGFNSTYKYPGAVESQVWLFGERADTGMPKGSMAHFGKTTTEGGKHIEGHTLANAGHARLESRGVFAETFLNPMTGEKEWREVQPVQRESTRALTDELYRPAAQHLSEKQNDTLSAPGPRYQPKTKESIAEHDRLQEETLIISDLFTEHMKVKEALLEDWEAMRKGLVNKKERRAASGKSLNNQLTRTPMVGGTGKDIEADLDEILNARETTLADQSRLSSLKDTLTKMHQWDSERDSLRLRDKENTNKLDDLVSAWESENPELLFKDNYDQLRFTVRAMMEEAYRLDDEYVTVTSMRGQMEAYGYAGNLGPEDYVLPESAENWVYYDENTGRYMGPDGEYDIDEGGPQPSESALQEAVDNSSNYDEWYEQATEMAIKSEARDVIESDLVSLDTMYSSTPEVEFDEMSRHFSYEEAIQEAVDNYLETNSIPIKSDYLKPDEGDFFGERVDEDAFNRELQSYKSELEAIEEGDTVKHVYVITDGDYNEYDPSETSVEKIADIHAREAIDADSDLVFKHVERGDAGITWHDKAKEGSVDIAEKTKKDGFVLPDPDAELDTGIENLTWGGTDDGQTEKMAKSNYAPATVEKSLRRVLRDMGLSNTHILDALVRVNIDVSGEPGIGRQQNVQGIKMTPAVRDAIENKKRGFLKSDPDRTKHISQRTGGFLENALLSREKALFQDRVSRSTSGQDDGSFTPQAQRKAENRISTMESQLFPRPPAPITRLENAPPEARYVPGQGDVQYGVHQPAADAAFDYMQKTGLEYFPPKVFAPLVAERGAARAREYEIMKHDPNDPLVKRSYAAFVEETIAQYKHLVDTTGLKVDFNFTYDTPRKVIDDVIDNNHISVFSTKAGYGSEPVVAGDNPMLQPTEFFTTDGEPMLVNDLFRVTHDVYGHVKNGVGFRARGEDNAWQAHVSMYGPEARGAMTTETRGQNSWTNFGPNGESNKTASQEDTVYADQKIGLMPNWVSEEGRLSATTRREKYESAARDDLTGFEGSIRPDGQLEIIHWSHKPFDRTDPSKWGSGLSRTNRSERNRKAEAPGRTFFGLETEINPYVPESGLGDVRNVSQIDPELIYIPANDWENLWQDSDNLSVITENEKRIAAAGYSGFMVDTKEFGKVVVVFDPVEIQKIPDGIVENEILDDFDEVITGDTAFSVGTNDDEGSVPMIANMKENPDYFREEKGQTMEVVYMSPDEYIAKCIEIFDGPTTDEITGQRMKSTINAEYEEYGGDNKVENIANAIKGGLTYEAPWLEYGPNYGAQEGLHRALAARKLGLESIPVIILTNTKP